MDVRDVCVIGGSRYFGRRVIEELRDAGVRVTVVNRGSAAAPPGVTHLFADRDDETALRAALGDRRFDVVIDQVCYTPVQAAIAARVFAGRTRRYLMTSTVEVYAGLGRADGPPLGEVALELADWPVDLELPWDRTEFRDAQYGEGKRQAEALLLKSAPFDVVTVRTAHVLGGADFTGRLAYYTGRIAQGRPVAVHPRPQQASFVEQREIARFLVWAARGTFTGPVNAASHGTLDVRDLCAAIERHPGTEARAQIAVAAPGEPVSPFSFDHCYAMDTTRAVRLGFSFSRTAEWLPQAIKEVQP
ncbi:NAD-dependent epimerase/dehydratase family protein [Kitasatospora nipponensis]|uniref:NAD-dependent epimerase/dehydratase family protein n=1 Tax=Kitasatospora nipponensis TaxID=258049 RepID=A0ABN1WIH4_9ACTN